MAFPDDDVQPIMDGPGSVAITIGATTANGYFDTADEELVAAQVGTFQGKTFVGLVKTGKFVGLAEGVTVMVAAVSYKVVAVQQIDDGKVTRFFCGKP
jgi:hypothetical protein